MIKHTRPCFLLLFFFLTGMVVGGEFVQREIGKNAQGKPIYGWVYQAAKSKRPYLSPGIVLTGQNSLLTTDFLPFWPPLFPVFSTSPVSSFVFGSRWWAIRQIPPHRFNAIR